MLIDFHIHVSRPEHELPWVLEFIAQQYQDGDLWALAEQILTPAGLRPFLQENGIDWAVALSEVNPITTGVTTNEWVADLCARANALSDPATGPRGRLIPFASINPFMVNDLGAELERLVKQFGFRGFKVYPVYQHHYVNDTRMYPLYAAAQELGVPMLVHTGSSVFKGARIKYGDPLHLDDVAIDFPGLTILMAHSGRPFWYEQAFWMARQHENVYLEVSGLPGKKLLEYFPDLERLADKVVYGSDWPGNPYLRKNVEAIEALPLRDETKEKILWKNAARVLGVEVRGGE
ncbi:MAG TPA: amidohydrolase family protein [Anaerolineae bacterium]|nr:amidohydrolase family protein [Anaerolineae bacterium]